jgi:peptide/nickel transport system permease protein
MAETVTESLDRALEHLRAGRRREADILLGQVLELDSHNERAWQMLSFAASSRIRQIDALRHVLSIDPGNRAARAQLSRLSPHAAPDAERESRSRAEGTERGAGEGAKAPATAWRVIRYVLSRTLVLALMVAIGVFLAIVVLNYGGYIDKIFQAQIDESLNSISLSYPGMSQEELLKVTEEARWAMEEAAGLHQPFLGRCLRWFWHAVTFDWGDAYVSLILRGLEARAPTVRNVILLRLPRTLLLAGTANLLVFIASVLTALRLSQKHGGLLDRIMVGLSPISTIPNWAYGILLTVIFAGELAVLPFGGMYDALPPATRLGYVPIVLKHMILPVTAIFLSLFFQSVYAWRTFFLVHSGEDYVEMAKAQGLPARMIERRYVLRPVLPYILTSFAVLLVTFWQGILVLETLFDWPGIGQLFVVALRANARNVTTAVIVVFALLLALSVLLLDIVYALVDPRVRVIGNGGTVRSVARRRLSLRNLLSRRATRESMPAPTGRWQRPAAEAAADQADPSRATAEESRARRVGALHRDARRFGASLQSLLRYPSAAIGVLIIIALLVVSVYALVTIPYQEACALWREQRPESYRIPENGRPTWANLFRRESLPPTLVFNSVDGAADKEVVPGNEGTSQITLTYTIDWPYGGFPQEAAVYFRVAHQLKKPFVVLTWITPDGRRFDLGRFGAVNLQAWYASSQLPTVYVAQAGTQQQQWLQGTGGAPPAQVLFQDPSAEKPTALKGTYRLQIVAFTFEPGSDVDAELVLRGQVYGWAGTDSARRDLGVALLWGAPVALAFGLFGAVATSLLSMFFAAVGAWFGGWVDGLVQRLTEINMILPALPMAIMIYWLYAGSIWAILGVIVLLNIFGSSVKSYRAAFLQVKEAPYVEAAQAYGASGWRIIRRYLLPRILPILIPQLVVLVPTYVFFEATLAFLGVSDPNLPTWGKVIYSAITEASWAGQTYQVLEPTILIVITGLAFAMVGFALDRVLNPRLRAA